MIYSRVNLGVNSEVCAGAAGLVARLQPTHLSNADAIPSLQRDAQVPETGTRSLGGGGGGVIAHRRERGGRVARCNEVARHPNSGGTGVRFSSLC